MKHDYSSLLGKPIACGCGRTHFCPIERVETGVGALNALPEILLAHHWNNILIAADENTFAVCGSRAEQLCRETGAAVTTHVFSSRGFLVPDEAAVFGLLNASSHETQLILGIGSGVINDICKYVAFKLNLPYGIIATAPSMDGYASVGAAMITSRMKVTYSARMPLFIIGDAQILQSAPKEMILAGYGDMLGKFTALNDWELSHRITGEHYCSFVAGLVRDALSDCISCAAGIAAGEPAALQTLMDGLVITGIAMSLIGNSRPASGSEHHLSHYYEITGLLDGTPYFHHGIDVAYASVISCAARHSLARLLAETKPAPFLPDEWERNIRRVYSAAADGVLELQARLPFYEEAAAAGRRAVLAEKRSELLALAADVPTPETLAAMLEEAGLPLSRFYEQYGIEKIRDSVRYAKDLKDRYTVWWMMHDFGILDAFAAELSVPRGSADRK
ncbi:MAG: sn-glycerol-1-phosphate dehydrogenase [Firmicutes bacterium]|nr:sn-glycerol-1-phosphate dehydrogenase [Bacillota bacterium]